MDFEAEARLTKKYNLAATQSEHTAEKRPLPGFNELVDRATRGGNHIFFGEPHSDGAMIKLYEMLANNPKAFAVAARNGTKHLVLEFPEALQRDIDLYQSGKISKQELGKTLIGEYGSDAKFNTRWATGQALQAFSDNFVQTLENANAAGMKIHAADVKSRIFVQQLTLGPPSLGKLRDEMYQKYTQEKSSLSFDDYFDRKIEGLPAAQKKKLCKDVGDHVQKASSDRLDDTAQYLHLRVRIPMGEGIMGVAGSAHLDNRIEGFTKKRVMGIDDLLEAEGKKVTTVDLHTRKTEGFTRELNKANGTPSKDLPDYTIIAEERRIYEGTNTTPKAAAPLPAEPAVGRPAQALGR